MFSLRAYVYFLSAVAILGTAIRIYDAYDQHRGLQDQSAKQYNAGDGRNALNVNRAHLTESLHLDEQQGAHMPTARPQQVGDHRDSTSDIEQKQRLERLSMDATSSDDPDVRAAAVQQLSVVQTPDVLNALLQASRDPVKRVRYLSVDSMRLLAANQGDSDGRIRNMLSMAMSDRDPDVASLARDAYKDIDALANQP